MAKLAIFLCAVLFASAVNASFVSEALISAINKTDAIITGTISATKQTFENIKNKALELVSKLEAAANSLGDKLFEQIKSSLEQAQSEVNGLAGTHNSDFDDSDCDGLIAHLGDTAQAAIDSVSQCLVNKLETGSGYVQNIITMSENVLSNLTAIQEGARHCGDNVDSVTSAAKAIVCTNMAGVQATWVATKTVPSLTVKMIKISYLIATLEPSLVYCSVTNEINIFFRELSTIVENTKKCIRDKINDAAPEVEYTTPKIL